MKKLLIGSLLLCGLVAQAQQLTGDGVSFSTSAESKMIHTQIFADEPFLCRLSYEDGGAAVTVFDENLRESRSFTIEHLTEDLSAASKNGDSYIYVLVDWYADHVGLGDYNDYLYFTETLFNDDASIEYGIATWKRTQVSEGWIYELDKIEIYSESGKMLGSLPDDLLASVGEYLSSDGTSVEVYKLGSQYFLYDHRSGYDPEIGDETTTETFWKINRGENGAVSFAKAAAFKGYPNPVGGGETFTVEVPAERLGAVNRMEVRDSAGRLVATCPVQDGKAQLPTRGLKGVCVYTVIADGSPVDSGKLIVK